jgi:predicted phosphodiesterase
MKYALIADIHEDIVHLQLTLHKIDKLKCDEIICLGDISGFSVPYYQYYDTRNASKCLKLIRENCRIIVAGNHDIFAARQTPKISPEFMYPNFWFNMDFHERLMISKGKIWLYETNELDPLYTINDVEFLKSLPEYKILNAECGKILLSHYLYPNITGSSRDFYSEPNEFKKHKEFMALHECKISITGHRHYGGLFIATDDTIIRRRYNSRHFLKNGDCIHVPQVARNKFGNGFCVFDSNENTIKTIRI